MIVPKRVYQGDTIGIVALSGPLELIAIEEGKIFFEEHGYRVKIAPSCYKKRKYLAGESDEERATDLMNFFEDDEIKAIVCMRGGYGCNRIMPYLESFDFSKYPKMFIGYSDITYLHVYLNQKHQLMTFHGPMILDLLQENKKTNDFFFNMLRGFLDVTMSDVDYYREDVSKIEAPIVGGNLSIICSAIGTPYEIDTSGKVLFIEEVNEPRYVVDRLLTQLKYSQKIDEALGIVIGSFSGAESAEIQQLLKEFFEPYNKPVAYNIPIGHSFPHYMLPLGATALLHPKEKLLMFYPDNEQ